MNRHTLARGIVIAALLAFTGGALYGALALYFPPAAVLRLTVGLVAAAYVVHVVANSGVRGGRIVVALGWLIGAALLAATTPPLALFVIAHAALLWLVRVLCCHDGPLAALADFLLSALALAAAVACARHTGSVALGLAPTAGDDGGSTPPPAAVEQYQAQLLLELAHRDADRRLGHMQLLRGPAEAALGRHCAENIQLSQVHSIYLTYKSHRKHIFYK